MPRVSLALGGGSGKDRSESWYARDIIFRSQKEAVFLAISFLLHPAVMNNRSHYGQCEAVGYSQGNTSPRAQDISLLLRLVLEIGKAVTVMLLN